MDKRAAEWLCCLLLCLTLAIHIGPAVAVRYPVIPYLLGDQHNGQNGWGVMEALLSFQAPVFSYWKEHPSAEHESASDPAYDRLRSGRDGQEQGAEDQEEMEEGHLTESLPDYSDYIASGKGAGEGRTALGSDSYPSEEGADGKNEGVQAQGENEGQTEAGDQPPDDGGNRDSLGNLPQGTGYGESMPEPTGEGEEDLGASDAQEASALAYSMEQLSSYDFLIKQFYSVHPSTTVPESLVNAQEMLSYDASIKGGSDSPQIFIYHTHASEYFLDSDEEDPNTLIPAVGEELARILREDYGLNVLHDTTLFPYQQAYSQGLSHLTEILEQYPSIEVVIDLHRDAAEGQHLVTEIDGKQTAQIMFFNGLSRSLEGPIDYLANPYLKENLAFSFQLKNAADSLYPGFARKNYLKSYRYNLHMRPCSVLIEVGAETNTLEEEMNAMGPLAKVLATVLKP